MTVRSYAVVEVAAPAPTSRDRFRRWVAAYGFCRLSRSLNIDRRNIHLWVQAKNPDIPQLPAVKKIIALSVVEPLSIGPLTYEDIYGSVKIVSHFRHSYNSKIAPRQIPTRRPY